MTIHKTMIEGRKAFSTAGRDAFVTLTGVSALAALLGTLQLHAVEPGHWTLTGTFAEEIALSDLNNIRSESGQVTYIRNGSWVGYPGFNFGAGANWFVIEAGSPNARSTVEVRTGSTNGPLLGTVTITNTGGFKNFRQFGTALSSTVSGTQNLYLRFTGSTFYLFDTRSMRFLPIAPGLKRAGSSFPVGSFDSESHPGGTPITTNGPVLESVTDGAWVRYAGFNFGAEANRFCIEAATPGAGGTIELRTGSHNGPLIGTLDIPHTGSWTHFRSFAGVLQRTTSGVHDLFFKFIDPNGTGGELFRLRSFLIDHETANALLPLTGNEDGDLEPRLIEYATGMHPASQDKLPLRMGVPDAAAPGGRHDIEVRLRADDTLVTKVHVSQNLTNWDEVTLSRHNGAWRTDSPHVTVSQAVARENGLFTIRLADSRTHTRLFARLSVDVAEGGLHVYPPVPGLAPSPYYRFEVQKVSALNVPEKQNATNWHQPFAWFTRCVDYDPAKSVAYYDEFIGGWSHTYCNFELDPHTPIVVKITRLDKPGAPSGPITSAAAHPAHKVTSCEVIGGAVYVTMSQPALVAIDIDGQLDSRLAPRARETGWGSDAFPYRNETNGAHGVTIFANPFIKDKPSPGDPGVFAVEPGTLPPTNGLWTTLYFKPGIHKLSVDAQGNDREWQISDPLFLANGKSYYIPGDAILYGNLNDLDDGLDSTNIRVFGHGTISGTKIPHWKDFAGGELPENHHKKLRMLQLTKARGCTYEGVTIADPAEHGVYIQGLDEDSAPNVIKWVKNITWRVNNDGGGVTGNGTVEDCFFRHQDDALYVRGVAIRRCVLWSDVNGAPLRCSFIAQDLDSDFPTTMPQDLVVEDIDIIYARGVFGGPDSTSFGVITTPGAFGSIKVFADGTVNTGQHVIFRNIRISDPKPMRPLLGFDAMGDVNDSQIGDWAGLRFENIDYQFPQVWGWRNRLLGSTNAAIRHWRFDRVRIGGQHLNAAYLADPAKFETGYVTNMIFK